MSRRSQSPFSAKAPKYQRHSAPAVTTAGALCFALHQDQLSGEADASETSGTASSGTMSAGTVTRGSADFGEEE